MNCLLKAICISIICAGSAFASDEIPGGPQTQPILLFGGDVYTVSGEVIHGGEVLFENGKIVAVGKDIDGAAHSAGVQRIDCTGKRVYPALFNANSELGLVEIDAVR